MNLVEKDQFKFIQKIFKLGSCIKAYLYQVLPDEWGHISDKVLGKGSEHCEGKGMRYKIIPSSSNESSHVDFFCSDKFLAVHRQLNR